MSSLCKVRDKCGWGEEISSSEEKRKREKKERKERKKEKGGKEGDRRFLLPIYGVLTVRIHQTKE